MISNQLPLDPVERRHMKQAARDHDDYLLAQGFVTAEDLQRRNGFCSSLNLSRSVIKRRNIRFGK